MPELQDLGDVVQRIRLPLGTAPAPARGNGRGESPGMALNMGQHLLPHVATFAGSVASLGRIYRPSDEALRDSLANARYIRNDLVVMECIEARQRSVALLNWHVEPPDAKDPELVQIARELERCIRGIPRFMQYRENLLHAVFFGRYAVAQRWRWKGIEGRLRLIVDHWRPLHGDKLVWRIDDGRIGVRVGSPYLPGDRVQGWWTVERLEDVTPTEQGLAYFLEDWQRPLLAVHHHAVEDGEYEAPEYAGRIYGVGIRSRIYWVWYQKQETLAWLMEYLERSAGGFEVWYYPWGNETARQAVSEAARQRMSLGRNQLLVPKFLENDQFGQWYDRIEPSMAGAEALKTIIVEYFGHLLKRYILGQTLTSEAAGTGLGSNLADVHLATFLQIIQYDATNLEETLTSDLVRPLLQFNWPWAADLPFRFRIDTETENAHEKLAAFKQAYEMGLKLKAQDVYDLIGASKPSPDDETLSGAAPGSQAPAPPPANRAEPYTRYREEEHPRDDTGQWIEKGKKVQAWRRLLEERGHRMPRPKVLEAAYRIFEDALQDLAEQHPQRARAMQRGLLTVLDAIPTPKIVSALLAIRHIRFYPQQARLAEELRRRIPAADTRALAFWDPTDQSLHLNGGAETEPSLTTRIAEIYANELAHAIDYREGLSNTEEWRRVWREEIVLSAADEHAIANPEEGFAVFAEWAWLYPEETQKTYPQAWQAFQRMGLL